MAKVHIQFQRRWRLADEKGKTVAEGFTSMAKAEAWAKAEGLEVEPHAPHKSHQP